MRKKENKVAAIQALENFDSEELLILLEIGFCLKPKLYDFQDLSDALKKKFSCRLYSLNFTEHMEEAKQIKLLDKFKQLSEVDRDLVANFSISYWLRGCGDYISANKIFWDLFTREIVEVVYN